MKERSLGDILNETFVIYGKGLRGFLVIAFIIFGPLNALMLIGASMLVSPEAYLQENWATGNISGSDVMYLIVATIVLIVAATTVFSATSVAVGQVVAFGRIDISACFARVAWRIYSLLFISFLGFTVFLIGIGGFMFLLIPTLASLGFLLFAKTYVS